MPELAFDLAPTEGDRIEQAEQAVRDFCGWHIAPSRTETVTLAGTATRNLLLPSLHVTAVTSVTVDGVPQVEGVDYDVHSEGYLTRRNLGWWVGDVIVVTFTHGYAVPPASVVAAVQSLAQNAIGNPGGLTRKTIGPFTEQYAPSSDQMAGLGAYRIVPVS